MDAYFEWLDIPRHKRPGVELPPHHYDLLDVELFSCNWTLIKSQCDRRMELVKSHELGPHATLTQKLLRELALARSVLLTPDRKAKYDTELRLALGLPEAESVGSPEISADVPSAMSEEWSDEVDERGEHLPSPRKKKKKTSKPKQPTESWATQLLTPRNVTIAAAGLAVGLLVFVFVPLVWWLLASPKVADSNRPDENSAVSQSIAEPQEPEVASPAPQVLVKEPSQPEVATAPPQMPVAIVPPKQVEPIESTPQNSQLLASNATAQPPVMTNNIGGVNQPGVTANALATTPVRPPIATGPRSFPPAKPPTQRIISIPPEKTTVTDSELFEFTKTVNRERSGALGHQEYLAFVQSHEFDARQQERVDQALEEWQRRDDEHLFRVGAQWLPETEVDSARDTVIDKVNQAEQLIMVGQYAQAYELLESASQDDPDGIKALYLLGLLFSLPAAGPNAADKAQDYFGKVLLREPDHPEALNSQAISLVKQASYPAAMSRFRRAADGLPDCSVVAHNVRRLLSLMTDKTYKPQGAVMRQCEELLADLERQGRVKSSYSRAGWLHMVPVFASQERAAKQANGQLGKRSSGVSFAVAPDLLVTSRRSVYSETLGVASEVLLTQIKNPDGQEIAGTVIFLADDADLAVVHAPRLGATPVSIARKPSVQGEMLSLLCRTSPNDPEMLRETVEVTAVPDAVRESVPRSYLMQLALPIPFAEGAAFNTNGELVSLVTGTFPNEKHSLLHGVTAEKTLEYLDQFWDEPGEPQIEAAPQKVEDATFRVVAEYEAGSQSLASLGLEGNAFNDRTCVVCNGRRVLDCLNRNCNNGQITESYIVTATVGVGAGARQVQERRTRQVRCNTCAGKGVRDCPACVNGTQ
ncbi:MAG: hypothetical protein KDA88_17700 [Planctomycetaceae bacterium]|nr:hypothetical protein [Planctomycetaceae bacterium]MCB9950048.1 hypothetical protein [Planctomycetaceae bacterium]